MLKYFLILLTGFTLTASEFQGWEGLRVLPVEGGVTASDSGDVEGDGRESLFIANRRQSRIDIYNWLPPNKRKKEDTLNSPNELPFAADFERTEIILERPPFDILLSNLDKDKEKEDDKSHNNLLLLGATGLSLYPAFYLGIFLHEGSHALVAAGRGQKILDFAPYPHSMNGKSYFGRVRIGYHSRSGTVERSRDDAWIASAPMILNTSLISGFTALKLSGNLPKNVWARH